MNKNSKLMIRSKYELTKESSKTIHNYLIHKSPLNQKLDGDLLKHRSRSITKSLILSGKIKKKKYCQKCFSIKNIQIHHKNYSDPYDIISVCKKCHWKLHTK